MCGGVMEREEGDRWGGKDWGVGKYSLPGGAAPSTEVHLTPPQRKNYTHPKLHSTPRLHKKQDTQAELLPHLRSGLLKSRDALQRMVTTSPPAEGSTNAPKAPCARMHPPTTSATHQPGPQPGGGAPQEPRGRLPGTTQEPQKPHPGQDHSPHAKPHKKPTPGEPTYPQHQQQWAAGQHHSPPRGDGADGCSSVGSCSFHGEL